MIGLLPKSSAERGELVTAELCFSASGLYMPPMLIFPRKRYNPDFLIGAPPGAWAEFHPGGWMQTDIFTKWFQKFVTFSGATKECPVLLLLDGHSTHVKNLDVIDIAERNGVIILSFPPHTTHKLQPLDVGFMKPLSTHYTSEVSSWMRRNPTRKVTLYQIFKLFGAAFTKSAVQETAVNAFSKTGICPFNRNAFVEADFIASMITPTTHNPATNHTDANTHLEDSTSVAQAPVDRAEVPPNHQNFNEVITEVAQTTFGVPVSTTPLTPKSRRCGSSVEVTSPAYKKMLLMQKRKRNKENIPPNKKRKTVNKSIRPVTDSSVITDMALHINKDDSTCYLQQEIDVNQNMVDIVQDYYIDESQQVIYYVIDS